MSFSIHPQLLADCIVLGRLRQCHVLLMNNSGVPWFILVPENIVDAAEIIDLSEEQQQRVLADINAVSEFVRAMPEVTKLNTAALGNVVPQLHIHIVGRNSGDYCWPKLVWASDPGPEYEQARIDQLRSELMQAMPALSVAD